MKNYNDNNLKEVLRLYADNLDKEFPSDSGVADVKFSPEFERKMNRIIKKRKSPFYGLFNTRPKKAVLSAAILIILLSLTLSVGAIRKPIIKMLQNIFSDHIELEFEGETKDYIAEIYAVTAIPDGYAMTDEMISVCMVKRDYEKEDGTLFSYTQLSTAHAMVNIDNEHSTHYKKTVDSLELYIADFEEDNIKQVYWTDNGYLFHLNFYSRPTDEEIIPIIKSNTIVGYQEDE